MYSDPNLSLTTQEVSNMNEDQARAIFLLAGIPVTKMHQLENKYWPDAYVDLRKSSPWWLAITPFGPIEIGWRKRVISIRWDDTPARLEVTKDETTKGTDHVHAWSYPKAVEYLSALGHELRKAKVTAADGGGVKP